jgi:hypothetical protein
MRSCGAKGSGGMRRALWAMCRKREHRHQVEVDMKCGNAGTARCRASGKFTFSGPQISMFIIYQMRWSVTEFQIVGSFK